MICRSMRSVCRRGCVPLPAPRRISVGPLSGIASNSEERMGHAALTVMVEQEYTETEDATMARVAELMAPYDDRWRRLRSPRCSTGWAAGLAWNTPMPIASATPSPPGRLRITRGSSMCSTSWATRRRRWSVAIPPPTMPRKRPTRTQRSAQRRGFWRGRTGPVNPLLPKQRVAGSTPVSRSKPRNPQQRVEVSPPVSPSKSPPIGRASAF